MESDEGSDLLGGFRFDAVAVAVVDREGLVVSWSAAAARLFGRGTREAMGVPLWEMLSPSGECRSVILAETVRAGHGRAGGTTVDFGVCPVPPTGHRVVMLLPSRQAVEWAQGISFFQALFAQGRIGVGVHDKDLRLVRTNISHGMFGQPAPGPGEPWEKGLNTADADCLRALLADVLRTGVPALGAQQSLRLADAPLRRPQVASISAFRLHDGEGRPNGVVALVENVTKQLRDQRHLALLHEAAARIGSSLDIRQTAHELADVLLTDLGSLVTVDLTEGVLAGDDPPAALGTRTPRLTRAAVACEDSRRAEPLLGEGDTYPMLPESPQLQRVRQGHAVTMSRDEAVGALSDPRLTDLLVPEGAGSLTVAPLLARGLGLGAVSVWRTERPEPLDSDELSLLSEIASRAALGIDNARRYAREHRAAVSLQERLLPRAAADIAAVEAEGIYRPATGRADIGGDWFDVVTLPSLRAALVIGDVIGHGLPATATMGRLRTAILTLADLELDPAEVLTRLDDLIQRLAAETVAEQKDAVGATCLYAVYDPVEARITLANAGTPPPVLISPDGAVSFVEAPPGPPLGVGGVPYESVALEPEPGSVLTLYTDGMLALTEYDDELGLWRLKEGLSSSWRPGIDLRDLGRRMLGELGDTQPRDDIALLMARTRVVDASHTANWQLPAAPESVAEARKLADDQLDAWGLDRLSLTTELIVSELVTNAVRYAGGPIGLRLIRDAAVLICEVSDPSNTQPRLVRAGDTDEGGRGLYIVAQCCQRWGSRYGHRGKTIWTEQSLDEQGTAFPPDMWAEE
ncbi:ATP-binding SpoIIE family protein phosphatase [Streptomyces sp. NRRL F-5126]|uniref:ATP-binding SpoIIE family protein phosphatase n=1 Tax=Streptomyces sp. NRRL F-5126 TaxID=1463857 RepID=UPI00068945CE|nr:SpoIIE family protein phosphatase [Streptomyces sp. NRRL F-5126]